MYKILIQISDISTSQTKRNSEFLNIDCEKYTCVQYN